jgi:hypothetical protein
LSRWKEGFILFVAAAIVGCGGPATVVDPPLPTQSVVGDWIGDDASKTLHFHVDWVQSGRTITLRSPCVPQDYCRIYSLSPAGNDEIGSTFPVNVTSGSGTFTDPGITFTVTTATGKTFTFTGNVAQSIQMIGTVSGPSHPSSGLQLDKQVR